MHIVRTVTMYGPTCMDGRVRCQGVLQKSPFWCPSSYLESWNFDALEQVKVNVSEEREADLFLIKLLLPLVSIAQQITDLLKGENIYLKKKSICIWSNSIIWPHRLIISLVLGKNNFTSQQTRWNRMNGYLRWMFFAVRRVWFKIVAYE